MSSLSQGRKIYSTHEMEYALTHDVYWNAAQLEMIESGYMQNYMRMYWCKQIMIWSETPEKGYKCAIYLNNKYELDGRDPNGYMGIYWCFGGNDRPFYPSRPLFGNVRPMTSNGLKSKQDMGKYVDYVQSLVGTRRTVKFNNSYHGRSRIGSTSKSGVHQPSSNQKVLTFGKYKKQEENCKGDIPRKEMKEVDPSRNCYSEKNKRKANDRLQKLQESHAIHSYASLEKQQSPPRDETSSMWAQHVFRSARISGMAVERDRKD